MVTPADDSAATTRLSVLRSHLSPPTPPSKLLAENAAGVIPWLRRLFKGEDGSEEDEGGAAAPVSDGAGRLALGTVQLGMAYGAGNTTGVPSAAEATEIVHLAVESGIGVLDTAHGYGLSEERIGEALKQLPTKLARPVVVTKIDAACTAAETADEARKIVKQSLDTSCQRLQMETLDTVLLHHFRMYEDHDGAAWDVLCEAKAKGKVKKIGCSTYEPAEVMEALSDPTMEHIQLPFNLLASPFKSAEFVRAVTARPDVTIHVRSIYLQGLLVADRTRWPAFAVESGLADRVISALDGLVENLNRSNRLDLCLAYVRGVPWINEIVLGAETATQVTENARACSATALTPQDIKTVDNVVKSLNVPEMLLKPSDWVGAVGFSNGQAEPEETGDQNEEKGR